MWCSSGAFASRLAPTLTALSRQLDQCGSELAREGGLTDTTSFPLSCRPFSGPRALLSIKVNLFMDTLAQLRAGQLSGITRLDLACGLTEFPREIFDLADSLEVLNLSGNALSSLPDDLHRLTRLRVLFCSDNLFTELPACLGQCAALTMVGFKANRIERVPGAALPPLLRWLILTDNCITELPAELGERPHLQKLMLAGNRLQRLPRELASLPSTRTDPHRRQPVDRVARVAAVPAEPDLAGVRR